MSWNQYNYQNQNQPRNPPSQSQQTPYHNQNFNNNLSTKSNTPISQNPSPFHNYFTPKGPQQNFPMQDENNDFQNFKRLKPNNKIIEDEQEYNSTPKTVLRNEDRYFEDGVSTKARPITTKTTSFPGMQEPRSFQMTADSKKTVAPKTPQGSKFKSNQAPRLEEVAEEGGAVEFEEGGDFEVSIPEWATKEKRQDSNGKRPGDPDYDPSTLWIPPNGLNHLSPTLRQYWQIKSQNFDKIILFKLGKFYELFFEDAIVGHKELDLSWMGNKMKVGFPEKTLDRYAYLLVNKGYKVCVVEQTETTKQMEERIKKQPYGKRDKLVKREPVQIMSRGTYVDPNDLNSETKVLLSFRCYKNLITVCFLEVGANLFSLGVIEDDENYTTFKTFISQIMPVEVLYETMETPHALVKIVKNCTSRPTLSPMNNSKLWASFLTLAELEKYYGPMSNWPKGLQEVMSLHGNQYSDQLMATMAGMISYLTKMLIEENVLCSARYEVYDPFKARLSKMMMDSQALQHLEILEVEYATKNAVEGSLLSYIDKTASPFGKRLLRKWICAPLLDLEAINDRLDAIEDLESCFHQRSDFLKGLRMLPDLERACAKTYNQSVIKNDGVVMFEDVSGAKLREFRKLTESLLKARELLSVFSGCQFKSKLMRRLTTFDDYKDVMNKETPNMPEVKILLKELGQFVEWEGPKKDTPVPRFGVDEEYDNCKKEIRMIEQQFEGYLKGIQEKFGGNRDIGYVHTKHRYELEIPVKLVEGNNKPREFELSSKKQGYERFLTQHIKMLVEKLEEVEERLKQSLNIFVCFLFSYFHKHYVVWDKLIEGLSQLDCLCSLSQTSFLADGAMCRPRLYPLNQRVFTEIRGMRHPVLSMNKPGFVPNDILLGDIGGGESKNVMLLTGPNMGGKSTILRQTCLAAILAQIGCYIPAEKCEMSLVDRIFTRLGSSDKLSEGKSTFYIEMEETVNIVKYGSMNSLAIMDELGRGTSTFDGVAIAYSVLKFMIERLGCRAMFATHYHVLLEEFRDTPGLGFFHMGLNIDYQRGRVNFLYKLAPGECSNSFGLNIARLSGMSVELVQKAREKADEFEKNLNLREAVKVNKAFLKMLKGLSLKKKNVLESLDMLMETCNNFYKEES